MNPHADSRGPEPSPVTELDTPLTRGDSPSGPALPSPSRSVSPGAGTHLGSGDLAVSPGAVSSARTASLTDGSNPTREEGSAEDWGDQTRPTVRQFGLILLITGVIGEAAAFILAVEKFRLLTNPFYTPSCNVGATLNCGTVMTSPQAEVFGFPNPLIGIAGFAILASIGAARLAAIRFATWFWVALEGGVAAAVVFVHWLIYQSVAVIGSLCPYCMVVWAVTITAFWYVSLRNLAHAFTNHGHQPAVVAFVQRYHSTMLALWLLALAALVALSLTVLR